MACPVFSLNFAKDWSCMHECGEFCILVINTQLHINFPAVQVGLDRTSYQVAEGESVDVTVAVTGSATVTGNVMVTLAASSGVLF